MFNGEKWIRESIEDGLNEHIHFLDYCESYEGDGGIMGLRWAREHVKRMLDAALWFWLARRGE